MTETFEEFVGRRFGGVIANGKHSEDGEACAIEARNDRYVAAWCEEAAV